MITHKILENLVKKIASSTDKSISEKEAIEKGHDMYLYLEFNSFYGGYRLVNVKVGSGAHYGAFGGNSCEGRLSAKNMYIKLTSLLNGILAVKEA